MARVISEIYWDVCSLVHQYPSTFLTFLVWKHDLILIKDFVWKRHLGASGTNLLFMAKAEGNLNDSKKRASLPSLLLMLFGTGLVPPSGFSGLDSRLSHVAIMVRK